MPRTLSRGNALLWAGGSSSTLKRGLAAYWPLNEAAGAAALDLSGNGSDLTDTNTVGSAAGPSGKITLCRTFAIASSQQLSVADNAFVSTGAEDFTFCCWIYLAAKTTNQAFMAKDGVTRGMVLLYVTAADRFQWAAPGVLGLNADTFGSPTAATWYFLRAWRDQTAGTYNISVNNGAANSGAGAALADNTNAFRIGVQDGTGSSYLGGRVATAAIWKRLLSSTEATYLYNAGVGRFYPQSQGFY